MVRWAGIVCAVVGSFLALAILLGPREEAELDFFFDADQIGQDIDAYLATQESRFDDITPGVEKRVIWAGTPGARTPLSIVYVHGFSATSEEIRPVPDHLAATLGANLVFTRLTGHGRSGAALAEATVADWTRDVTEALELGRRTGEEVIFLSTSTGGTLVAALLARAQVLTEDVKGAIFVSPNFALNNPAAPLLTWPWARYWIPLIAGETRSFEPANNDQATYWTTQYPIVATLPLAALVKEVETFDFSLTLVDALFWYHPDDQVVRADATDRVISAWRRGFADADVITPDLGATDDPFAHVVTGDILSPDQTDRTVDQMRAWIEALE